MKKEVNMDKIQKDNNEMEAYKSEPASPHLLRNFFIGVVLLGVGLFWFSQRVSVQTSWFNFYMGGVHVTGGMVVVPLIIGILVMFVKPKAVIGKIITTLGAIFIVASVIMSVDFHFMRTSLYEFILIIGFIAAGSGMILRVLFKK
jgi:hypothetical protein